MSLPNATLPGIPAAQYLRMSTERQEYSLDNQAAAIERYAEQHGFSIVQTYEDAGKSGLTIKQRSGLKDLLAAILDGSANYRAVLVYDVSRWGRFQDADEAAHYEYLCKQAGIPVHYAAEQFGDGDTLSGRMMKALKRTMAAEFSRELSERVFSGKKRLAELGFHEGGPPGYGLRRVMISADGRVKQELKRGEAKSLTTDRVILVPGTPLEMKWIKWIYSEFIRGEETTDIVKQLNLRKVPWQDGKAWNLYGVRQILTNPKYAGCNAWGLRSQKLRSRVRYNPREQWVLKPGAFTPIADQQTFDRVQRIWANKTLRKSNEMLLKDLKRLWRRRGRLSESIIDGSRSVPAVSTLRNRFGGMAKVYALIGFRPKHIHAYRTHQAEMKWRLRGEIVGNILALFAGETTLCRPNRRKTDVVRFHGLGDLSIMLCRSNKESEGMRFWSLYTRPLERALPTLMCLMSSRNNSIERFYLVPNIDALRKLKLTPVDRWFQRGIRLRGLSELKSALIEVLGWVPLGPIHRVSGAMAQLMGPASRARSHDAERLIARAGIRARRTAAVKRHVKEPLQRPMHVTVTS
jgi:DNA invertase Pin-like site-specific DNA recombinase